MHLRVESKRKRAHLMFEIFGFLAKLMNLLMVLLFIRILMSWVAPRANWYNQPLRLLYSVTEPVMAPFRALIPPMGGIDFSPMILFLVLGFLEQFLSGLAGH